MLPAGARLCPRTSRDWNFRKFVFRGWEFGRSLQQPADGTSARHGTIRALMMSPG